MASTATISERAPDTAAAPKYADSTWYIGVVKHFKGSFGFLICEELQARFPGQDVFLLKSDCCAGGPRVGDRMQFRLVISDGNPKAVQARLAEEEKTSKLAAEWKPAEAVQDQELWEDEELWAPTGRGCEKWCHDDFAFD